MTGLPSTTRLVPDEVPAEHRTWVEKALIVPLNRFLTPVAALLGRLPTANLNMQVLRRKLTAPSSWTDSDVLEFASALSGPCVGVWPVSAHILDAAGQLSTNTHGLTLPAWDEKPLQDRTGTKLRITNQPGLAAGSRYEVVWIAFGG